MGTVGHFQLGRDFQQGSNVPWLRAIALPCITAKNREQVGVIEFWGAQATTHGALCFVAPRRKVSGLGKERVLFFFLTHNT